MPKGNANNREQRHEANRAKAQSFMQTHATSLQKATGQALGKIDPNDTYMRLSTQALALAFISEGARLLIGMGADDGEMQNLVGKAAYRAKAQHQAANNEISKEDAANADDDFIDALATSHTDYEEQPQVGEDPNAPEVDPAPQAIDQSQPVHANAQPSAATGQTSSPANSPQDKLTQASMSGDANKLAQVQDDINAQNSRSEQNGAGPKDEPNDPNEPMKAVPNNGDAGAKEGLGVADVIDGEVVKANQQADDPKAKAAADARNAAANAAS